MTAAARDRIVGLIGTGADQGADLAVDGRELVVDGHEDGFFVGPTVIDRVTPEMDVYTEEIFGPVLSVLRVEHRRRGHRADQQPTRTATAPRSSPPAGPTHGGSSAACTSG